MKRRIILLFLALVLTTSMMAGGVFAQAPGDPDGDGVFGTKDHCPNVAGPASNNGCPLPQPTAQAAPQEQPLHPPGDSDGDGTLDEKDKCPLDGGPDWNNGCPTDLTAPPQSQPQVDLPTMPTSGECMIATTGQDVVNTRAMPGTTSAIIAVLHPADLYPAFATFVNGDGIWYLVRTGWASGNVLRIGGACDQLPSFDFGDVQLNFADGPEGGVILNFLPVPGGKPFVTMHPFASPGGQDVSLNFTKLTDVSPDAGFSFLLVPFPGTGNPGQQPDANPASPGSDVFDDGFLLSHMGDGSVFILMPPTNNGDNPLDGILIGLSKPDIDPNHILIGLSKGIVSGDDSSTQGILIGMLLPAVQTGNTDTYGILIGLLVPAVQTGNASDTVGFSRQGDSNGGGGGNSAELPVSVQKVRDMGLNFFVPSAGAAAKNLQTNGWGVEIQGIVMPTE